MKHEINETFICFKHLITLTTFLFMRFYLEEVLFFDWFIVGTNEIAPDGFFITRST